MKTMENKVALVTGAAQGIGLACAQAFAREGADVILADLNKPEEQAQNKERRKAVSKQMKPARERLRRAEQILEKSPHLYELLKQEHELEKKARARYKERGR